MARPDQSLAFCKFEVLQVAVPSRAGFGLPSGAQFDAQPIHLVVGTTNQGSIALGEASRVEDATVVETTLRGLLDFPLQTITPSTAWMKSSYEEGFFAGMVRRKPLPSWEECRGRSIFLLESLWLDAMGQAAGVPAHVLLGGAVRPKVRVDYWAAQPDAPDLARLVAEAQALGCTGMKLKSSSSGNTVLALREIAADLPEGFQFTIDPMFNWRSLHESRKLFEILDALPVTCKVEDPFPFEAIDDWHAAQRQHRQTLIWHTRGESDLQVALREGTADAFNIACRSTFEAMDLAKVLAFHAKDCWFGSQLETGVFQQVRLHAASAAATCVLASDLQSQWVREHTLVTPAMTTQAGEIAVGNAPGLGVKLDWDAVLPRIVKRWTVE